MNYIKRLEAENSLLKEQLTMKIKTNYEHPPIPLRQFDWSAVYDNYEPGDYVGHGETEEKAIADLKEKTEN